MNYIITGGTGFIGTHLTNLIKERYPNAQVYNLDIVKPGTPNPVVKDYKPALRDGQKLQSTFIEYDIRKPIENLPFTPTEDDVIFNFAAVHRTPGHEDHEYFETNIRGAENVVAFAEKWNIKKIVFTCLLLILHMVFLSWWQRRFMRSGRMAMRLIVSSLSFALVWYSERVRMVISPDCIGLSVVISLRILAERIPSRLVSM